MSKLRSISKVIFAPERPEGLGAFVRRSIGVKSMKYFNPFLLLDHFNSPPTGGFPDHPHRGQETITLMFKNYFLHEDFTGASGVLRPGDLQFMTAGQGIMHSEMPYSSDESNVEGLQLWIDLPKDIKHTKPRYRDLRVEEIPIARPNDKVKVSVISGKSYGVESGHDLAYTSMEFYSVTVAPGGVYEQEIDINSNVFVYILRGDLNVNGELTNKHHSVFLKQDGNLVQCSVPSDSQENAQFVVIAGEILNQSVVQGGPFVETTREDVYKAFDDYDAKTNGFERGKGWKSSIADGVSNELFVKKVAENLTNKGLPLVPDLERDNIQ